MKKYISMITLAVMWSVGLTSCDEDTKGLTSITYYPVFTMDGPQYDQIPSGTPYTDPGCSALLDGKDVTDEVEVVTAMNIQSPAPGYYTINYRFVNDDGFVSSVTRYVLVADPNDKASGYYTVNDDSYRVYNGTTNYGGYSIRVVGDGEGNYEISDLLGGWYEYRAGYGSAYALTGDVTIDADGNITLVDSYLAGWEDSAESLENGKFDAATGTITWKVTYTTTPMIFVVNATKDNY